MLPQGKVIDSPKLIRIHMEFKNWLALIAASPLQTKSVFLYHQILHHQVMKAATFIRSHDLSGLQILLLS